MMYPKLIFLDIDGVLNTHDFCPKAMSNRIHYDKIIRFNHILEETGAFVVLSSAWRYIVHRKEANLKGFEWLLRSHGMLAFRLVGITAEDTMMPFYDGQDYREWPLENERGTQIANYLKESEHQGNYVVIDDGGEDRVTKNWSDLGITKCNHPVVWTKSKVGLTDDDADTAIQLLNLQL